VLGPWNNTSFVGSLLRSSNEELTVDISAVCYVKVATVVGRADLLSAFCFMLAFISYVSAVHSGSSYSSCYLFTDYFIFVHLKLQINVINWMSFILLNIWLYKYTFENV